MGYHLCWSTRGAASDRSAAIFFAALLALVTLICGTSRDALASVGCNAVNTGGFNVSAGGFANKTVVGFAVGDKVTFTVTWSGSGYWLLRTPNLTSLNGSPIFATSGSQTRSYTVTGDNQDTTLTEFADYGPTVTASCTEAPAAGTSPAGSGTVTTSGGTSATSAADEFTYTAAPHALLVTILPRPDPRRRSPRSRPALAPPTASLPRHSTSPALRR